MFRRDFSHSTTTSKELQMPMKRRTAQRKRREKRQRFAYIAGSALGYHPTVTKLRNCEGEAIPV
jgi:hypothetical protein